jgi:endonuclease G
MKKLFSITLILSTLFGYGQDSQTDYSTVNEHSKPLEYLLPLFTIHGVPKNQNVDDTITILINHGYCVGYSTKFNQPVWAAYQISRSKKDVDYERFPFFVDDTRLKVENRIGTQTFGSVTGFDLGHLAPNAAINKQYSKLSQMETFLMSNICPQSSNLNQGVWQKLESEILNKYPYAGNSSNKKDHVWVIVGPVFSDNPQFLTRDNGVKVAVPDSFFCILARPKRYPYDTPGNSDYLAFLFSQNVERKQKIDVSFLTSINEIERLTNLNFFPELTKTMEGRIENPIAIELW